MNPKNEKTDSRVCIQIGSGKLGSKETLKLKSEFDQVRENGAKYVGKYMLLVSAPSTDEELRFGIICGRKYSKKAVLRNRARRLLKESYRFLKNGFKTKHCVFIARQSMKNRSLFEIEKDMIMVIGKAKMWKKEQEIY